MTCRAITRISNKIATSRPTPTDTQSRNTSEHERGTFSVPFDLIFWLGSAVSLGCALALILVTFTAAPWERSAETCHVRLGWLPGQAEHGGPSADHGVMRHSLGLHRQTTDRFHDQGD